MQVSENNLLFKEGNNSIILFHWKPYIVRYLSYKTHKKSATERIWYLIFFLDSINVFNKIKIDKYINKIKLFGKLRFKIHVLLAV